MVSVFKLNLFYMDEFENAPINVKATLMANSIKLQAIIDSLNGEQLENYNRVVENKKAVAADALVNLLSREDIDEFLGLF